MKNRAALLAVAFSIASLAMPALTQTEMTAASTTAAPVAYVYVQTSKGINLYEAAANGKLALVKGSPFYKTGEMIGSNKKYFITLGTHLIHSYAVESNGAIGKAVSSINSMDFEGSACGPTDGAVLDHTGRYVSVLLDKGPGSTCTAFQTFAIATGSGKLTFRGATVTNFTNSPGGFPALETPLPTTTANDKFAYAVNEFDGYAGAAVSGFSRTASGALNYQAISRIDPTPPPDGSIYIPLFVKADPTNHLAVMLRYYQPANGAYGSFYLASYTVGEQGNIASTNTSENMPQYNATGMSMSPSGKLLAVSFLGFQIFHFNGADPITPYVGTHTSVWNAEMQWDNNNHLYVLNTYANPGLYVYTVTPTSFNQAPGSPYNIPNKTCNPYPGSTCPNGLVVVNK